MFKIAIIGRPNVGKSTLFNRLAGKRLALTHDKPGLTRDRKSFKVNYNDINFEIIDTAGLEIPKKDSIEELMMAQTDKAIEMADLVLFLIDGRAGVLDKDKFFAQKLRKSKKKILLVVNKCENEKRAPGIYEGHSLGFGEPAVISAEHAIVGDLYDRIEEIAKQENFDISEEKEDEMPLLKLAILGRPNVGKSTLFNAILGENRAIISNLAGTTRDTIFVETEFEGEKIYLYDTAGIRRKHKNGEIEEELSVDDTIKTLNNCNIAILVVDAEAGIDKQELHLADQIFQEGKGMIIAMNKWDKLDKDQQKEMKEKIESLLDFSFHQGKNVPYYFISALENKGINKLLKEVLKVFGDWNIKISTSKINQWLEAALEANMPPMCAGRRVKLKYATQVASRPPKIVIFSSTNLKGFPESYIRYLTNSFKREFGLIGTPVRISLKRSKNPFDDEGK
ncbi:MAG: ribosome biogenesis GTPase Der [Rickettsiales bacterium]|nr:ribosome biogenesis GTPase Der [Rickettsiales bacterium]